MEFYSKVTHLHLEPTGDCNAQCPLCPRNVWGSKHINADVSTDHLDLKLLDQIDLDINDVLINGNYGDWLMHPDAIEMVQLIKNKWNPHIQINTNGAARNKKFWQDAGQLDVTMEFSIEGVDQDVHSYYRRNTQLHRLMENAEAYINAGGKATWIMTVFEHNQHQVEACKQMSDSMGFDKFEIRYSHRQMTGNPSPIMNNDMQVENWLWPTEANKEFDTKVYEKQLQRDVARQNIQGSIITRDHRAKWVSNDNVNCNVKDTNSIYVSANGELTPCCYLGKNITWDNVCDLLDVPKNFNRLTSDKASVILEHRFWKTLDSTLQSDTVCSVCNFNCKNKKVDRRKRQSA
jgi:MoaA/NifB/PqqE/SkfB family radical SAM enzyme